MDLTPEQNKISEELLLELRRAEIGCTGDANGRHTLGECCERAGLAEVIPKIRESAYRAGREDAARDIRDAIRRATDAGAWYGAGTGPDRDAAILAYDHAAGLAWMYRVPDCGDEYHGADGGPCSRCGFDVADQGDQRICTCPDCDVTAFNDKPAPRTVKGLDPACPVHGGDQPRTVEEAVGDNPEEQRP